MIKKIFIFLLFGFSIALPQRSRPIYFEDHVIPADSEMTYYLSYRIPFNNLVFVKQNGLYTSGITLNVEAQNKESKDFYRESVSKDVEAEAYEDTKSENLYAQGLLEIRLPNGNYSVFPSLKINNIQRDISFQPLRIDSSKIKGFLKPFVLLNEKFNCEGEGYNGLINFAGDLPFGKVKSKIAIAVKDSVSRELRFKLFQKENLIFDDTLTSENFSSIIIEDCGDQLILDFKPDDGDFFLYEIKGISGRLLEGKVKVEIYENDDLLDTLKTEVVWIDKPASLYKMKSAIENLTLIATPDDVKKIKSADEEKRYRELFNYWKAFDPTPATEYNEIMAEFYKRVDEADQKYSSADNTKGSTTDRGEVYIKYGEPDTVNRFSSDDYASVEVWKYSDLGLEFYFADNSGLGNFRLIE